MLTGLLLSSHWLSFFYAIGLSSVAFGLLTFASFPLFTIVIDSISQRLAPQLKQVVQCLFILVGVGLLMADQQISASMLALIAGLISALTFALLLHVNKRLTSRYSGITIAAYQNLFAFICCLPGLLIFSVNEQVIAVLPELALLGIIFTALAHSMLNQTLKTLSAFMVGLAICLEPVYGAIAALLLLAEPITSTMMIGGLLILSVNLWQVLSSNKC